MRNDPNFETFLNSIKTAKTTGLGKDAEYALWINTYNALAIRMVNDNPVKKRFFGLRKCKVVGIRGKPFSTRFRTDWYQVPSTWYVVYILLIILSTDS